MRTERHLRHVEGYLTLGMLAEAAAELERIPAPDRDKVEVLNLRLMVLQAQENWPELARISAMVVTRAPENAGAWITWAYATRRAASLAAAEKILLEAEIRHPQEPTIQFNLGCYACLQGRMLAASRRVKQAIAIDPQFKQAAASDPDLIALRDYVPPDSEDVPD